MMARVPTSGLKLLVLQGECEARDCRGTGELEGLRGLVNGLNNSDTSYYLGD